MFEVVRTSMRSDLFSAMAMHAPPIGPTDILSYGDLYGQERIDRHPSVPHILLTVHGTVPTTWTLIGKAGRGLAGWVGGDQPQPRRLVATQCLDALDRQAAAHSTAILPVPRPTHLVVTFPIDRLEPGDPSSAETKKSWAESLRTTRRLYPSDFRGVTPALN